MFDRFGEFDSAEEINQKAEELLKANDRKGLRKLAKENGIDPSEADAYAELGLEKLASPLLAAKGCFVWGMVTENIEEKAA